MLTRRHILRASVLGAAGCLIPTQRALVRASQTFWENPTSPSLKPFQIELPIPGALDARRPGGQRHASESDAFADLAAHCAEFVDAVNTRYFHVVAEERYVSLHPDLDPTRVWGYRPASQPNWPVMLGPTFLARIGGGVGQGVVVRCDNALPSEPRVFGVPRLTVHLHGGHHPAESDGFATDLPEHAFTFGVGDHYDYSFPLCDVGFSSNDPRPEERTSTMWYHDHFLDFTGPNVYSGLAGTFLVFDELDAGDETNWDPGLGLPSGEFDVPIVLQDRVLAADGSLLYDPLDHDGFLGDTMLVNGVVRPYMNVKRRKYRFRFLNGANARFFLVAIADGDGRSQPFDLIASEGGLLSRKLADQRQFLLANAERVEVVFDFSRFDEGRRLYIENRAVQDDGRGPDEFVSRGTRLLEFRVGDAVDDFSRVPDILRPCEAISPAVLQNARRRTFEFERRHGAWVINGELAGHLETPVARPRDNGPEVWRLINSSGGWWHPVHVHSELGRVIRRNGRIAAGREQDGVGKKDTFVLGPNDVVDVFFNFRDYHGPFAFHCHNIEHEDRAMMARFDVVA